MKFSGNIFKALLLTTFAYVALSVPATTLQPVEEELATTLPPAVEVKPTAKPGAVELLDIAGADIQRAVFHQKHTVPDGTVIGTYGYFDSREKYHVLNYVNDAGGLRVISDYTPFDPLPGTATAAAQEAAAASSVQLSTTLKKEDDDFDDEKAESTLTIETKETKQTHVLNKNTRPVLKKQQVEILETGDGDNLLRDEHSIIRTHALPPPGHYGGYANAYYGHHGAVAGFDNAAYPQGSEILPLRRNISRYNHVYNNVFYGAQGNGIGFHGAAAGVQHPLRRIPLPYENPLYPLLYGDQSKLGVHSETERGDDINDTSGLDASDAGGEVPSNPGKVDVTNQVGIQTQHVNRGSHYGQAAHIAVGQIAGNGHLGAGVSGASHVNHGHVGGAGHLGGAHFAVLAPSTTIHHGYAGNHLDSGAHGYHQGYYPAPQVSAYYQQGYYPQQGGAYVGHQQAGYHQSRFYAPPNAGYAQSHRYYYRYPSQQYGYSHGYQG